MTSVSSASSALALVSSVSAGASATASATPIRVLLRDSIDGATDFYPFNDIAKLSAGADSTLTFKELFTTSIEGGQEIVLFGTGCEVDGVADCTYACNKPKYFFGSLETFYNCAALASISYWTQDAMVFYITNEAERNASRVMGSGTLASFDSEPVLKSLVTCAQDACEHDGLSKACDRAVENLSQNSSAEEIFDALEDFCPDLQAEINPDIFGPGVLISYVLQVSFSVSLYLLTKGFTLWVRVTQGDGHKPKETQPQPFALKRGLTRIESMIWRDNSALSRTSIAIATTLVEFQEAQCWFIFALQIASILAIVVNSSEGTFWGEMVVNSAIAYHVSQNGVLPIFLVQALLHHEGIRGWNTFVGFLVEYILAIVATGQKLSFDRAFENFKSQSQLSGCGYNPSPRAYCAATNGVDGLQFSVFPHPVLYKMTFLILNTIAILALIIDQVAWALRTHHGTKEKRIGTYRLGRMPSWGPRKRGLAIKRWFWRFLEVSYLVINIMYMISLTKVITAESFAANKWSYGQIIAVTVWGPVIVKLFDLMLSGPPKNGLQLNSGPPRLRIDNVINHRAGTSADEVCDESFDEQSVRDSSDPMLQRVRGTLGRPEPAAIRLNEMVREDGGGGGGGGNA
ncbi:hypothetical protein B0T10DRAFT_309687 [Thelonectria olida]|uniref:Uncharacterized protein n=1 Tax=Thelonectria olida TaxID=1576542 RepID=A0A9P8W7J9_9HYPO|nr:hypothetical protein B0T10DRAFT_309687 [Thelonectria olida]